MIGTNAAMAYTSEGNLLFENELQYHLYNLLKE
jgi:hypothetical protein